jgi:hypothetical protein
MLVTAKATKEWRGCDRIVANPVVWSANAA